MSSSRERFERELGRSRYLGRFVVVVEGGLPDVLAARRQMSEASVIGTLAAWQRRYAGFFFAGSIQGSGGVQFSLPCRPGGGDPKVLSEDSNNKTSTLCQY
jgi:hypothetical protein